MNKNPTFKKTLDLHKILITNITQTKNEEAIIPIIKTAQELSLVYAQYKCEKCGETTNLQYHHLIQKKTKKYTDQWRYLTQRHYWANILILCKNCHAQIEHRTTKPEETKTISQTKIDQIKQKYETKNE